MLNRILCKRARVSLALPIFFMAVLAGRAWSNDVYPTIEPPIALEVSLTVKNRQNAAGDILVVSGTGVEVEFTIKDPLAESTPRDSIQLRRPDTGEVVFEMQRGVLLQGISSLKLDASDCPCRCALVIEYLHAGSNTVLAAADKSVIIVEDSFARSLLNQISALEVRAMN